MTVRALARRDLTLIPRTAWTEAENHHHAAIDSGHAKIPVDGHVGWLFREFCDPGNAGCKMTRLRSRPKPARPYICRLIILILLAVPSTLPELQGRVSPLMTACWSLRMPVARERRSGWPSSACMAVSHASRSWLPVRPVIISAKLVT